MNLKAIETKYNGYRFRSRLEARWAVFLDEMGIKYEYEKEGFDLGELGFYLPDFWLPEHNLWLEVKGAAPTPEEMAKCGTLATQSGHWVNLVSGEIPAVLPHFLGFKSNLIEQCHEPLVNEIVTVKNPTFLKVSIERYSSYCWDTVVATAMADGWLKEDVRSPFVVPAWQKRKSAMYQCPKCDGLTFNDELKECFDEDRVKSSKVWGLISQLTQIHPSLKITIRDGKLGALDTETNAFSELTFDSPDTEVEFHALAAMEIDVYSAHINLDANTSGIGWVYCGHCGEQIKHVTPQMKNALDKARSARFEHGESGGRTK
jgi:hypothetical protein